MGKRKSSKKPVVKRTKETLSTTFKCLFCHHEKSVTVKIDKQSMFGSLHCKICGQKFTAPINNLSAAVDVYCDWVDACEDARQKQPAKKAKPARPRTPSPEPVASRDVADEEEDDDDDDLDFGAALDKHKRKSGANAYDDEDDDDDDDDAARRRKKRREYDSDEDDDE